jgi:hypothetical protein
MKKTLVLAVCLAVLASGSVFALDLPDALKINGLSVNVDLHTGLRIEGNTHWKGNADALDEDGNRVGVNGIETANAYAYSADVDNGTPFRAQLVLQYAFENIGIYTRFRYDANGAFGNTALSNLGFINRAFIWGTVLDKKVKATVGKGLAAAWGLFYSNFTDDQVGDFDGQDGVRIEITPITGLNVGVFYGTGDLFAKAVKPNPNANPPVNSYTDVVNKDSRFVLGAKYNHSLFGVVASWYHNFYDFDNDTTRSYTSFPGGWKASGLEGDQTYIAKALPNTSNLLLGFQFKGTESVPLTVDLSVGFANLGSMKVSKNVWDDVEGAQQEASYYNKGDFNPYWSIQPKLKASYDITEKFSLALGLTDMYFADGYYAEETGDSDLTKNGAGLCFPITINLEPGFAVNDKFSVAAELSFKINAGGSDQFGFGFTPSAEFDLGNGAKFVVFNELVFYGQSKFTKTEQSDLDWQDKHEGVGSVLNINGTSGTVNTLQFDFVWSF